MSLMRQPEVSLVTQFSSMGDSSPFRPPDAQFSAPEPLLRQPRPDRTRENIQRHLTPPAALFYPDACACRYAPYKSATVRAVPEVVGDLGKETCKQSRARHAHPDPDGRDKRGQERCTTGH